MLRDYTNVVNAFIHAPLEARIERVMRIYSVDRRGAEDMMQKTDKRRATYYSYFTNSKWSEIGNYDIAVNSAKLGVDGSAEMIIDFARRKEQEDNLRK